MTKEKIKQVMDACYQAKRVRDMMPKLPNGVTPTHIHYLDVITRLERPETEVKVSDISDELGLPRPGVTKTIKDMERLGFVEKKANAVTCVGIIMIASMNVNITFFNLKSYA